MVNILTNQIMSAQLSLRKTCIECCMATPLAGTGTVKHDLCYSIMLCEYIAPFSLKLLQNIVLMAGKINSLVKILSVHRGSPYCPLPLRRFWRSSFSRYAILALFTDGPKIWNEQTNEINLWVRMRYLNCSIWMPMQEAAPKMSCIWWRLLLWWLFH